MTKKAVIEKAENFCKEQEITTYPVKIIELCNKFDIKVFEEYLPPRVSGFIVIQKDNFKEYNTNKVIVVNALDSASRRRFTITHELAHYILHRQGEELYAHRDVKEDGKTERIEVEANIFASNVLMPKKLIENALDQIENYYWGTITREAKIEYIATKFAVSIDAAKVRLLQLELI